MTDPRPVHKTEDEGLIAHFREHSHNEPPASLDAFILATAHREAPVRQPGLWQRWLRACQQPRWQMAFATLAGVALLVGVVMREPVPSTTLSTATFSASAPQLAPPAPAAAPAPAPMARMAMAPQAEQADAAGAVAEKPAVRLSKRALAVQPSLEEGLQEIVRLRKAGENRAADEKLLELHQRFPAQDVPARLEALQVPEKP